MGVLQEYSIRCACGEFLRPLLADSVNAGRTPEFRAQIIEGTFHRVQCSKCNAEFTVEKQFSYADFEANVFYLVKPRHERHLSESSSRTLQRGIQGIPPNLSNAARRHLRVVFGLGELREKLVAQDAKIDDRAVEMLKILLFQEHPILLARPRLRFQLDAVNDHDINFVAGYDHNDKRFAVSFPRWIADDILEDHGRLEAWCNDRHGASSIYQPTGNYWVNVWRWSPQPSAIQQLSLYANQLRAGQEIDVESTEFNHMLKHLPQGTHLPSAAKQELQLLFDYAKRKELEGIQDALFEIRFGIGLEDDWSYNNDPDDIATIWDLLKALPETNVEGNTHIHEILLAEGKGGGWYEPWSKDIYIGSQELIDRERFEDVLRHEVGHAVHEKNEVLVNTWLADEFGWKSFNSTERGINDWVAAMGGWNGASATQRKQVSSYLLQALGGGSSWEPGPAPNPPKEHLWWSAGFGPRLAFERTGSAWYQNHAQWYRSGGYAFFLNYWYRSLMVVNESTLDLVSRMPSSYAAMSPFEFFAELYALYYDLDDPERPNIPDEVAQWLQDNIGAPEPVAPASPSPGVVSPWHWIKRPHTAGS